MALKRYKSVFFYFRNRTNDRIGLQLTNTLWGDLNEKLKVRLGLQNILFMKSFFFGIFCSGLIFFSLYWMNLKTSTQQVAKKKSNTKFEILEKKVKVPEQVKKSDPEPKKDLAPKMDSILEGFAFGIPSLELDLNGAQAILNDVNGGIMSAQAVDTLPRNLSQPKLDYPSSAYEKGIQGFVEVSLLVSELGQVERVNILKANPKGIFEAVTKANVSQWRFEPAEYKGQRVSVWLNQTINFALE